MIMDSADEFVTLSRRVPDTAAQLAQRMANVDRTTLPTLDEARAALARDQVASASEIAPETLSAASAVDVAVARFEPVPPPPETSPVHEIAAEIASTEAAGE